MKKVLILGAGLVARPLVRYLLEQPDIEPAEGLGGHDIVQAPYHGSARQPSRQAAVDVSLGAVGEDEVEALPPYQAGQLEHGQGHVVGIGQHRPPAFSQ